jgi:hypothetical protein
MHTAASVCDWSSAAACAQVEKAPIEQIESPQAQTSSEAAPLTRNPQCGIACVSTTTVGQSEVATPAAGPHDAGLRGVGTAVPCLRGAAAAPALRQLLDPAAHGEDGGERDDRPGEEGNSHAARP